MSDSRVAGRLRVGARAEQAGALTRAVPWVLGILLGGIGVLTAFPIDSFLDPSALGSRYGVAGLAPVVEVLLRHRGMLQLVIGAGLVWAAFRPEPRIPVILAVIASKASFIWLVQGTEGARNQLTTGIQRFDAVCVVLLVLALALELWRRTRRPRPAMGDHGS